MHTVTLEQAVCGICAERKPLSAERGCEVGEWTVKERDGSGRAAAGGGEASGRIETREVTLGPCGW